MREIAVSAVTKAVRDLCIEACCKLPKENILCLNDACSREASPIGREILGQLVENAEIAAQDMVPLCQDTGLTVVFADIGQDVHLTGGDFTEAVNEGVRLGYTEGYLRKSCVSEPLFCRENTGDNTPAILHMRIVAGDRLRLVVAPKGAGSENKSRLYMLVPADGIEGVCKAVIETVSFAGPNSCPPMIIGVGIGGTMETACLLAKRAAVRSLGTENSDERYAALEKKLLNDINRTGIGPQGLGGSNTAFAVHIEWAPCHIASLPVAININCHAARHAAVQL